MKTNYKFISHTADIKFEAYGKNLEEIFSNSLLALKESITKEKIRVSEKKVINLKGNSIEKILYKTLEEILFLFDSENFLFSRIEKIKFDEKNLSINLEISGTNFPPRKNITHIKAVTYSDMQIKKTKDGFTATVVLDI